MVQEKSFSYICSEVYGFLNYMGEEYILKLPENVYSEIVNNRDANVVIEIDEKEGFNENSISKEALGVVAILDLQFWCSEEERKEKAQTYYENQKREEEFLKEKYNMDNIFKNEEPIKEEKNIEKEENIAEETSLTVYEDNIFAKIKFKIFKIIRKILNKEE